MLSRLKLRAVSGSAQSGQAIVWMAVMMPFFLSVVGLAIDGGIVFSTRRELQNVADSAARAGAMQIDQRVYRDSSGATVVLDASAARQVAGEYLASQGSGLAAMVTAEPQRVVVQVSREVPTGFLRLVGIETVRISAVALADVRYGIDQANR
ncbi:MAG: pilus assembly protein TadG-related protein [Dehalococcoidales bacterium]|nr:pilus assembly protein TadG-related protein [Dehalococcoidales bacterium]